MASTHSLYTHLYSYEEILQWEGITLKLWTYGVWRIWVHDRRPLSWFDTCVCDARARACVWVHGESGSNDVTLITWQTVYLDDAK
jgi:hypothetical protein